ncbi:MAG: glycolate oxidase [Acidobacteriota bacterium]|nr:glycolate oxidase [Acidobacteriota bacterium]
MDQLIENLRAIVGRANVLAERDELLVYECDGLTQHRHAPRAVVFPASTEEVSAVLRELARAQVSFAPRGAGTGLSGGALAVNEGVVVELARMRRLLKLDVENRIAVVETGMVNAQLSRAVAPHGLYYAPDPSSGASCTVGGNIAENAGGIHCLKYGVTTDHVVGARVVLSNGEVVSFGASGAGDCVGYDLLGAFVGSEGTFGIATEATVKLLPLPQSVRTLLADFTDINDASRAVSAIIAAGLIPAALEMVDGATIRAVEASVFAAGLPIDAQAALLIELDGLEDGLDDEMRKAQEICLRYGARGVRRAADERERKKLWAARKGAFGAMGRLAPDMMLQDAVVPRSRLPEVLAETYRISAKYNLILANVFHAGDGNLHPILCFDRRNADELRRVECANREIVETCIRAGGTLTGEHGVGLDKSKYMPLLFSADTLDAMLALRAAFDPSGLCNPGKIIPAPRGCGEARIVASFKEATNVLSSKVETNVNGRAGMRASETHDPVCDDARDTSTVVARSTSSRETLDASTFQLISENLQREFESIAQTGREESRRERLIVSPASTEEAIEVLKVAARAGVAVVPAGRRAWLGGMNTLQHSCIVVSTLKLNRIISHEPADLVATVEAGLSLSTLNAELARADQWLPLDPPDDGRATVGGIVSTGAAGAHSFAYGSPRAFVLGMRVVLADGREIGVGGRVVKNVAGYDLCKLFAGSFGTLGLITEITFKLRPRPEREATLSARAARYEDLFDAARLLRTREFHPVALELFSRGTSMRDAHERAASMFTLLIRFAGSAQSVGSQLERAQALLKGTNTLSQLEVIDEDTNLWREIAAQPARDENHLQLRLGVLPTLLPVVIQKVEEGRARASSQPAWIASLGAGRLRVSQNLAEDGDECAASLARLRAEVGALGGSLVVERAPEELRRNFARVGFDQWGAGEASAKLMRGIKRQLDPQGILSPELFFA